MIDENKFVCKEDFLSSGAIKEANLNSGKKKTRKKKKHLRVGDFQYFTEALRFCAVFVCLFVCLFSEEEKEGGKKPLYLGQWFCCCISAPSYDLEKCPRSFFDVNSTNIFQPK